MSIVFLNEATKENSLYLGGKGLSLAKLYQFGFKVPNAFVISSNIFEEYIKENNLDKMVQEEISNCNIEDDKSLEHASKKIKKAILNGNINMQVEEDMFQKFDQLTSNYVAIRSSATAEDGKNYAWAGQLDSYLNVTKENVIESIKKCFASLFNKRALYYRIKNKEAHNISVAVVVQEMIQSEASGVAFSVNPVDQNQNQIIIEAIYGLGELIVSGSITPDQYTVKKDKVEILGKEINNQIHVLQKEKNKNQIKQIQKGKKQKLEDETIIILANIIKEIEKKYGYPVDVEWSIKDETIYILQCRPITTLKKDKMKEVIDQVAKLKDWKYEVTRNFNFFVWSSYLQARKQEVQEKYLGFFIQAKNNLILNGDEYVKESDFIKSCEYFKQYFEEDITFFERFAKKEFQIVEDTKDQINKLKRTNFKNLSKEELIGVTYKFNEIYLSTCVTGTTRPENFLEMEWKKNAKRELNLKEKELEDIFEKVSTCPNNKTLKYSKEPLDLLIISKKQRTKEDITKQLEDHVEEYKWMKGPVLIEDICFKKEDYMDRLTYLKEADIEEKINNILNARKKNDIEYEEVLKKYTFSTKLKKLTKAIRDFIFLRTYTTEYSDELFYTARHTLFKEIASRCSLKDEEIVSLAMKDILEILEANYIVSKEKKESIKKRKEGFSILLINGEISVYFGKDALTLQSKIGEVFKINNKKENKKAIVQGTPANKGKVVGTVKILQNYNDIHKLEKGDILVASMTTPDYISAMEKATGFITDEGGITCHAAILSREFDVPCIVGTNNATKQLKDGQLIELDAYSGIVTIIKEK